jgi:drug/metabolite transporter (DMT)-like permease
MSPTQLRGVLLAALACTLVGASFTANSTLLDYPHAGGQALRYGLAALLLIPLLDPGSRQRLAALTVRQWGRLALLAAVGMVGFNLAVLAADVAVIVRQQFAGQIYGESTGQPQRGGGDAH